MKSVILTLVSSFIILTSLKGQWEIVNEDIGDIHTADFINKNTGWIAGDGVIFKTNDGGKNWTLLNENWNFHDIDFINDLTGWAICDAGILKTLDGGYNWFVQEELVCSDFECSLHKIYAVTENIIYVIGNAILKTSDGGLNWVYIYPDKGSYFNSACFLNADTGIVAGGNISGEPGDLPDEGIILITFNGGETWNKKIIPEFDNISNVKFIDKSTGYFLAEVNDPNTFSICKTIDAFSSWSVMTETNDPIRAIHFFNNDVIISIKWKDHHSYIMKSKDGGLTWEKTGELPYKSYEIYFGDENVGYILCKIFGSSNIIMKSVDQGNNWTCIQFALPFKDICFINQDKGFVVGGSGGWHWWGSVFMTNNGGLTWEMVFNYCCDMCPNWIFFINNSTGYMGPLILHKTIDGGETWIKEDYFSETSLVIDVFFVNEYIGFASFENGEIHKTTDGGESWEIEWNDRDVFCDIRSIFFIDEFTGWAVGTGSHIIKFSGQQAWEIKASGTGLPLNKVFFTDRNSGWISGGFNGGSEGFHPVLLKTEDGGESWIKIENINYLINDFYFKGKQHGWAVGEDKKGRGIILRTNDGGNNWAVQIDSLSAPLKAIQFKDRIGWAVGDNGLILTNDPDYTSIPEHYIENNSNYIVLKNYPNPSSSSTVISYWLPVNSDVELSVYNLLGQKITTLIKERQQSGSYEVEWDAERMKQGIYYCELKTNQGRKVMKMILLK